MSLLNSKRKYRVVTVVPNKTGVVVEDYETTLNDIVEEGNETAYALQEIIDEVMDIPEGCTLAFRPVRGALASKGILYRIK